MLRKINVRSIRRESVLVTLVVAGCLVGTAAVTDPVSAAGGSGVTTRVSVSSAGAQTDGSSIFAALSAHGRYVVFTSFALNLVPNDTDKVWADVFVRDQRTGTTEKVSVNSSGVSGNNGSGGFSSVSADGRFVTFISLATNLVPGDTNGVEDVFIRDRLTGTTRRVSVSSDGVEANARSDTPSISSDGRFVAFLSFASNLVTGDTNNNGDVFVWDRSTGTTELASVTSSGIQGNFESHQPAISADGRFVAFVSVSKNLVRRDTNNTSDVFVHNRLTGRTTRVSVSSNGAQAHRDNGPGTNGGSAISADGRFVMFGSFASNLVPGDTNAVGDVFVHDRLTGRTTRVSVSSGGGQANGLPGPGAAISADGRFVTFTSVASNLVSGDTNGAIDVFIRDRSTGITRRVSVSSDGAQTPDGRDNFSQWPAISADGRSVAFESQANNLVPADTNNLSDVFVHQSP
jgi:hypothetical protein